jgi:hypothetical protein
LAQQLLSLKAFAPLHAILPLLWLTWPAGISGYTLGGGWSTKTKLKGLGVDNVLSYTVALADGRTVVANKTGEFSDLFW